MRSIKAIFKKQLKDTLKNPAVLIQFIIFPLIAFLMNMVMNIDGLPEEMVANMPNMVTMQATIFAGMGLIPIVAGIIAEDIERKSLRFLMMAGVKPSAYLIGVSGVIFIVSFFTSVAFGFISEFNGQDFWVFVGAMMSGVAASIVLGATIGILTKNQQAATALSMPAAIIFGFGPMMAQFNETIARALHIVYTQQLNVVTGYLTIGGAETGLWQSFAIIWANVVVLAALFAIAYKKKGLRN